MDRWLAGLKGTLNPWDAHRVKVYNKEFRAEHAYQLVLWVLRKVPLLGIK